MLAPAELPTSYAAWNQHWHAPFGRKWRKLLPRVSHGWPICAQLVGMFAFQPNNTTRVFEYPWAFETIGPAPRQRVLEIGGGLSGFQFALSRSGCRVTNVDPGNKAHGKGWPVGESSIERLNRRFGTDVTLAPCFIDEAQLPSASFDCAVSVSAIEHIPDDNIKTVLEHVGRVLVSGGRLVLTLDLFLDIAPFEHDTRERLWQKHLGALVGRSDRSRTHHGET